MISEIQKELQKLEQEHNIKILYAVESGSRAWGFESTDSDWDVRYLYIHKPEWYLSIDDHKDSREKILPNDIDLAGWELRKALKLFRKSNPPLMEWLRSPIIYAEHYSTAQKLRHLSKQYFNPKACLYHYLHMAEGNYRQYLQKEMVRIKKYFYVLRPILACEWIKNNNSMPPMEFDILLDTQIAEGKVKAEIEKLLARKRRGEELNEEQQISALNDFLADKIIFFKEYAKVLGRQAQPETDLLNELFRETLKEAWMS